MKILSQALTWFGLSLVPPPPFTSMIYQLNPTDMQQYYHLAVAEHKGGFNTDSDRGSPGKFQWGRSKIIEECRLGEEIDKILDFPDRNMILVGLGKKSLRLVLETGSVNTRCFDSEAARGPCPPFLNVLPLFGISCRRVSYWTWGLKGSLKDMGEQPEHLDISGNSSRWVMHFVVRTMIEVAKERKETRDNLLRPGKMQRDFWGSRFVHPMSCPVVRLPRT